MREPDTQEPVVFTPQFAAEYKALDPAQLGLRIKAARLAAGLTQPRAAGQDMSTAYLSRVETGQRRPSLIKLERLARRCGVSVEWFVSGRVDGDDKPESGDDVRLRVLAVLPAECWVTRSSEVRCADLAGGTFPNGAKWSHELNCLPCTVRAALA